MSGAGKVVCVTGASGYVASYLVKLLLERGYTVKATVRNLSDPSKVLHLKALEGADQRLQLFEADLLKDGSFDSVVDGCEGVFHTASPVLLAPNDPQTEVLDPAVKGTLNVLKSCSKFPTVRRVVLTSSIVAVLCNRNTKGPDVVVDETWFSDKGVCEETKIWYPLSKIMAEEAAGKFAEENGLDLIVMNPGLVIGPLVQPTVNVSIELFLDIIKGKEISYTGKAVFPTYEIVDIRDVAYAHVLGFENPSASGRYCLAGTTLSHSEIQHVLHKLYPSIVAPFIGTENPTYTVSNKKAESLGFNFMPLEITIKDTVEHLKEKNLLSL
ncbi:hypothetical protein ACS0TY_007179 [Phlomoides rotata]